METHRKPPAAYPRVQKWCAGRPPIIRVLAKLFVLSADDINWGLNEYTNNVPLKAVTLPDDPVKIMWLYRRNRIVRRRIMANMFNLDITTANFIDGLWCHMRTLLRRSPDYLRKIPVRVLPRIFQRTQRVARKFPRLFEWLFDRAAIHLITSPPPNRSELAKLNAPEIQVYARIMAHCYLLTGLWPSQLLRKARNGDTKALLTLLRFDRSVIQDPKIRVILHREEKLRPHTYSQILTKLKPKKGKRIGLNATRYHFSAMLRVFGKKIGHPVTIEDLIALWHAYDADCGKPISKTDIAAQEDAMKKGVTRQLASRAPIQIPTILP
jgi:hypothetical protein